MEIKLILCTILRNFYRAALGIIENLKNGSETFYQITWKCCGIIKVE